MRQYGVKLPLVNRVSRAEKIVPAGASYAACPLAAGEAGCVASALPASKPSQETPYPPTTRRISSKAASGVRRRMGCPAPWRANWCDRMRKDVEIRARPRAVAALAYALHLARRIRHCAVFFVGGKDRQNDIGTERRFRKEHLVDDQQFALAQTIRGHNSMGFYGVGANHIERLDAARHSSLYHGRGR